MIIRAATAEDLPRIAEIQRASPQASQWEPAGYLEQDCQVAIRDGRLTGFLVTRRVGPGEHEILNLAVDPAERRKGVARMLLEDALARGGAWFLEVRASNAPALRLYETAGFTRTGLRANYYSQPAEDAIVMRFFS